MAEWSTRYRRARAEGRRWALSSLGPLEGRSPRQGRPARLQVAGRRGCPSPPPRHRAWVHVRLGVAGSGGARPGRPAPDGHVRGPGRTTVPCMSTATVGAARVALPAHVLSAMPGRQSPARTWPAGLPDLPTGCALTGSRSRRIALQLFQRHPRRGRVPRRWLRKRWAWQGRAATLM